MIVVSDTGPLIALAKVDQLSLLEKMFGEVHIPPAVHRELLVKYELFPGGPDEEPPPR